VTDKEGIPMFYIRIIAILEGYLMNFASEEKKKLSKNNNLNFNRFKHQIKKNNQPYEKEIAKFKEVLLLIRNENNNI
jgi:translation initiation factor 3 subunit C